MAIVGSMVAFSPTVPVNDAIDIAGSSWYAFGSKTFVPDYLMINDALMLWNVDREYPEEMYIGKQSPMVNISYLFNNGLPVKMIMPYEPVDHQLRYGTPSQNCLPELSLTMVNNVNGSNVSWSLFYAKAVTWHVIFEQYQPAVANTTFFGRIPYIYNNSKAADNVTTVTNGIITSEGGYQSGVDDSNHFILDARSSFTFNGSSWDISPYSVEVSLVRGCRYIHRAAVNHQQEVWPRDIYEGNTIVGAYVDIDMYQSQSNSLRTDVYNGSFTGDFEVVIYKEGTTSQYFKINNYNSNPVIYTSVTGDTGYYGGESTIHYRFIVSQPLITIEDGSSGSFGQVIS